MGTCMSMPMVHVAAVCLNANGTRSSRVSQEWLWLLLNAPDFNNSHEGTGLSSDIDNVYLTIVCIIIIISFHSS